MRVRLFLAMNDNGGYPLGKVRRIEVFVNPPKNGILYEPLYTLEPAFLEYDNGVCVCEIWNGAMQLKLSRKVFNILDYTKNAGNITTNSVTVTDDVHASIFRYLRSMYCKAKDKMSGAYTMKRKWQIDDCLDEWLKEWNTEDNIGALIDQGT